MKKRLTAWIMILIMCLSLLPVSVLADLQDPTAGLSGSGTGVNPYLIETADQLYDLAMYVNNTAESYEDVWFVLANDIGTEEKPFPYVVIGATDETPFKGHFDGCGYTVTVQTDGSAPDLIDLFPNLGGVGVVENLNVRKVVFIPCYVTIEVESASRMLQFPKLDETGLLLTVQPDPEKEGFVFNGYLDEDGHRYFDGDTIPADAFTLENGAYRITLVAEFTQEEDPDVTYTDVDRYYPTVVVVSPDSTSVDEIGIEYNPSFTVSPYAVSLDQCVDVNFPDTFRQMRQYVMMGLSPVGYRSLITGNVFKRDDALAQPISIALNKLPTPKYIGRELEETSATTGNRISNYEITDYLVPLFSFDDGEGAFLDPLYELTIYYEVPDKITNSDDPDAGYFLAGTETISISMNDLVGDGLIELTGAPEYTGYIFEGYSSLADPEGILFEDNLVILDSDPDYGNVVYDGNGQYRLMVKLHYREDPNYTPDPMTLTYYGNCDGLNYTGSAPVDDNIYDIGGPFPVMGTGTIAVEGYHFLGWNTEIDGSGVTYQEGDVGVMPKEGALYAQWMPDGGVFVNLDANGGTFSDGKTEKKLIAISGDALEDAEGYTEPTLSGYTFAGWATASDAEDPDTEDAPDQDNTTLYAVWSRKADVNVLFDANGGTLDGEDTVSATGTSDEALTLPEEPTRTGYFFDGWNTEADGTGTNLASPAVYPDSDTTYYAKWIPREITVRFLPGEGGSIVSGINETTLHTGETLEDVTGFVFPTVEEEIPYVFSGWLSHNGDLYEGDDADQLLMDHTFTGEWDIESFTAQYTRLSEVTITFDYAGGADGDGAAKKTFTDYECFDFDGSLVPTPTRSGYAFKGWDAEIPTAYPAEGETVTLHALWEEILYTVTFEMNGHGTAPADQSVMEGKTAEKPEDPAAYGYTFDGWYADAAFSAVFDFDTAITEDTTIYARWRYTGGGSGYIPVTYTLTFNTNGGSSISSVSGVSGKIVDLDKYVPTKDGFDFGGWYSDSALTNPIDEIKLTGNKSVYAKWIGKSAVFPFTDVKTSDWSYDDIYYVWEKGLMQGTSETTFAPKIDTSRAMIVTILWRLEGEPVVNYAMSFDDVADGQWYTEAIRWAQANNIVNGYSAEKFGPTDLITREQMAAILYRYAQSKGEGFTGSWMFLLDFEDAADISSWADEAMHWCVMKGLINGIGSDLLDPQGYATREQVAAILHRFCENIVK